MTIQPIAWLRRRGLFVAWAGLCGLSVAVAPTLFDQWQLIIGSQAQVLRGPRKPPADVVILAIDDYSLVQGQNADLSQDRMLQRLDNWPWPRAIYDRVLERLFAAGASAVGFDILFDSPSSHGALDDKAFATALSRYQGKVVLGAQVFESRGRVGGVSLSSAIPELASAAGPDSSGLLNGLQDSDGYIRMRPSSYAQKLRESGLLDVPAGLASRLISKGGLQEAPVPPLLRSARPLLDLYGPPRTIATIPIWEVLDAGGYEKLVQQGAFKDRVVFIGPTAGVLQDIHRTVFAGEEGMPGVEIHAAEIGNRVEGRALFLSEVTPLWGLALAAWLLLLGLLSSRLEKPMERLGWLGLVSGAMVMLGLLLLATLGIGAGIILFSGFTVATGLVSTGDATVRLQLNRLRLRRMLERYLSPAVAAQVASQPEEADSLLGGRACDVVVFICDVRGFTTLTNRMNQEGRVVELLHQLNEYFEVVVNVLHSKGATVDKYMGDAVLAVFGAPLSRGLREEVQAALEAVVELGEAMDRLNARWQEEGKEPWLQVVVLSAGVVISGNVGSSSRMDYTIMGDAVNLASRLEGVAKQANRSIVVSQSVAENAGPAWQLRSVGEYEIRGQGTQEVFTMDNAEKILEKSGVGL